MSISLEDALLTIHQQSLIENKKTVTQPLSKPFKTKDQAEKARLKYPHRERGTIGVGVIRVGEVIGENCCRLNRKKA